MGRRPIAALTALLCAVTLAGCTGGSDGAGPPVSTSSTTEGGSTPTASESAPSPTAPETSVEVERAQDWGPVSLPALAEKVIRGDRLRFTADRERTASYVSREVTYRVRVDGKALRISGVLNVPTGKAPAGGFPTVVLAHGYIDPAYYVTGQGMTRERGWLAERGYIALHVDYRNHAASDADPGNDWRTRLGYVEDVVAAADALRRSDLPVDDDRVFLMGRSMGGGVALRTAVAKPGVFRGLVAWASVSSSEPENLAQFLGDPEDAPVVAEIEERVGLPGQPGSRRFWRGVSARTFFDRVEDPVLLIHGDSDDTCPPRWARDSYRLLRAAGADARIGWYADEHAFGPRFDAAMRRSVGFFASVGA